MTLACTYSCASNGFEIHVYQHNQLAQHILQLQPAPVVYFTDFANAIDGATYLGDQNVGGSSYSDLYCDQAGNYLNGSVYQNEELSQWNSHTTPLLHVSGTPCGQASINDLLGQIADYTNSPQHDVPEACTDLGCSSLPSAVNDPSPVEHGDPDDVGVQFEYCYDEVSEELYPCEHGEVADDDQDGGQLTGNECFDALTNTWGPCLADFESNDGSDQQAEDSTIEPEVDASNYNGASLDVSVLPPNNGTCTVEATMMVQAPWTPYGPESELLDLYWSHGDTPDVIDGLDATVSYLSVAGGLHVYHSTFEVPVSDLQHSVWGFSDDELSEDAVIAQQFIQCQCAPLVGDFDGNGNVGTSDLIGLLSAHGTNQPQFDLDGDGIVGTSDLIRFLATYGQTSDCLTPQSPKGSTRR